MRMGNGGNEHRQRIHLQKDSCISGREYFMAKTGKLTEKKQYQIRQKGYVCSCRHILFLRKEVVPWTIIRINPIG